MSPQNFTSEGVIHNQFQCDRCGRNYPLNYFKREYVKGSYSGLTVCGSCWDPDHPQYDVGSVPMEDPQGLRNHRPDVERGDEITVGVPSLTADNEWEITVSWSHIAGAKTATVYRSDDDETWVEIAEVDSAQSYADITADPETTYYYRLDIGYGGVIPGATTASDSVTTPACSTSVANQSWEFETNGDTIGWSGVRTTVTVGDDCRALLDCTDPFNFSNDLENNTVLIDTSLYTKAIVHFRNPGTTELNVLGYPRFGWDRTSDSDPWSFAGRYIDHGIMTWTDGTDVVLEFDLASNPLWSDTVDYIELDRYLLGGQPESTVELLYVRLEA